MVSKPRICCVNGRGLQSFSLIYEENAFCQGAAECEHCQTTIPRDNSEVWGSYSYWCLREKERRKMRRKIEWSGKLGLTASGGEVRLVHLIPRPATTSTFFIDPRNLVIYCHS